jgi:glycosyltransferase involved in cell wall biosynthesis
VLTHGIEGLLVPPKNEEMLAQALVSLLTNESLRQEMGARARLKAKEYGWEHIAQMVLNYYVRILSEPPWKENLPEVEAVSV